MVGYAESSDMKEAAETRFRAIINTLRDKRHTVFSIVLYPESTPILESYRAMLDLKEAGIETQLVIANMVLPEEVCGNDFFRNRRKMQIRHLKDIKERFNLPMLQFPMLQEEIKGLGQLKQALMNF
jgi:arsenite-transporting ATPase